MQIFNYTCFSVNFAAAIAVSVIAYLTTCATRSGGELLNRPEAFVITAHASRTICCDNIHV
jgi:hypothetical protein